MVVQTNESDSRIRFVVRPNRSLSWHQLQGFFALMVCVTMGIAVVFAMLGFWPILPFAGLELVALGAALWLCARAGCEIEMISVDPERIEVQKGPRNNGPSWQPIWQTQTAWAQVRLQPARIAWYPSRLVIRSHGTEIQLAGFLNDNERQQLAGELQRAIAATAP